MNHPTKRTSRRPEEKTKRRRRPRGVENLRQFATTLFEVIENNRNSLLTCPACRKILESPMTVDCGHTFCSRCLWKLADNKCSECRTDASRSSVNVLVHGIVSKWRERHPDDTSECSLLPKTKDILGFEPRYHLRTRYVGLQMKDGNVGKVLRRLLVSRHCRTPLDKFLRKTSKLNNQPDSFVYSPAETQYASQSVEVQREANKNLIRMAERIFMDVQIIEEKALKETWKDINPLDLECILCSRCLLEPVTTTCGHTFCRECLARVFDHGLACPLCMNPLDVNDQTRSSTKVLEQAIHLLLPKEFEERTTAARKENQVLRNEFEVPMFLCTNAFPGVACPLYVYEPRYRLLARRCLQSPTKRFGMAMKTDDKSKFAGFGTLLEVRDALHLEDGRSILTTIGVRRFRVVDRSEQDGYDTALVQYIRDNDVPPEKLLELSLLHDRVHNKASRWVRSLTPALLAEVERSIGKMPPVERNWMGLPDGPAWAWWLMPILPVSSHLQVGFLSSTSLEKRLRAIDKMLEHMKIRMKALERNTLNCADTIKSQDSCSYSERSVDISFSRVN